MKSKRTTWLTISISLLIVGSVATFIILRRFNMEREADALWNECRSELIAAGEPITLAEIEARRPVVPDAENGSLIIETFASKLQDLNSNAAENVPLFNEDQRRIDPFVGIAPECVGPMRAFLMDNRRLIDDLSLLNTNTNGRLTNISYDFKGDNPNDFRLPSLAPWSVAGKLMRIESIGQFIEGDINGGMKSIVTQFGIAATMRHEPNFKLYSIRMRTIRDAISSFKAAIRTGKLDLQHLDRMASQINAQIDTISPAEVMRAERAFHILAYESLAANKINAADVFCDRELSEIGAVSKFDIRIAQVRAVSYWPNRIAVASDPEKLLNARKDKRFRRKSLSIEDKKRWLYRDLLPNSFFSGQFARTHALLRCAITGIAAERFRLEHDRFPDSLEELVPTYIDAIPNDPFTRKPVQLAKTDIGIVIYSFGIDEEDDRGNVETPRGGYGNPDIGFRLANPTNRGSIIASPEPFKHSE